MRPKPAPPPRLDWFAAKGKKRLEGALLTAHLWREGSDGLETGESEFETAASRLHLWSSSPMYAPHDGGTETDGGFRSAAEASEVGVFWSRVRIWI